MDFGLGGLVCMALIAAQFLAVVAVFSGRLDGQCGDDFPDQPPRRNAMKSILVASTMALPIFVMTPAVADERGEGVPVPGATYELTPDQADVRGTVLAELQTIEAWLTAEFGLPASRRPPRVEFVKPERMAILSYGDTSPQALASSTRATNALSALSRDTVAIYLNSEQTIISPLRGVERALPTYPCWCTKWFITSRMRPAKNLSARKSAKN